MNHTFSGSMFLWQSVGGHSVDFLLLVALESCRGAFNFALVAGLATLRLSICTLGAEAATVRTEPRRAMAGNAAAECPRRAV